MNTVDGSSLYYYVFYITVRIESHVFEAGGVHIERVKGSMR